uniref:Uncharacterized protein n=1 Tax=Anguilla anguilla TaxID=7936 RepID=A0A0E9RWV3_ANGAN
MTGFFFCVIFVFTLFSCTSESVCTSPGSFLIPPGSCWKT